MDKKKLTIGILAHVDAGKTTLSEALLFASGAIRKQGRVDSRDTFLDTDSIEKERGITIFSKQARIRTDSLDITLLDTPGHVDFSSEMERTLQVLDYAVLVISGTAGVQPHTVTLWELLAKYRIPVFIFITKMDVSVKSPEALLAEIKSSLSENAADFEALSPAELQELAAMSSEKALEKYLSVGRLSDGDVAESIRSRCLFPCVFGSGLKLAGIDSLFSVLEKYTLQPKYPDAFGAKIYKIERDAQGNRLSFLKITGGSLRVRDSLRYADENGEALEEKISQLRLYSGRRFETVDTVSKGDICAVLGLSRSHPGQGLGIESDSELPVLEPVLSYRVLPFGGTDERKVLLSLRALEEEDPQLHVLFDEDKKEIQLRLMGKVQTEVIRQILSERFGCEIEFDTGFILYKETLEDAVEGIGHYEPLKHYAEVHLILEPLPAGSGLVFDSVVPPDTLDVNWQRLVLTHLGEKVHRGVLTGSPITDLKISLVAGKAHLKHTEGGDFRQATYRAVRQGLMKGHSVLLEPVYDFRLEVPSECIGRAISDIRLMGGEHSSPETSGDFSVITGSAPVAKMADYFTEVLAYTHGLGKLSCRTGRYVRCKDSDSVIREYAYDPCSDLDNTPDSVFCAHGAGFNVKWSDVDSCAHISPCLLSGGEYSALDAPRVNVRNLDLDEKELEAIMLREFGPIKRPNYTVKNVVTASPGASSRVRPERILVDGYNLIFAWDELKALAADSLDAARDRLEDILASYRSYSGKEIYLIYDAYKVPGGLGSTRGGDGFWIAFTKEGESADIYIERLVGEIGKNESVRVVTSDALIRLSALKAGVLRTSSREFCREVEDVLESIRKKIKT